MASKDASADLVSIWCRLVDERARPWNRHKLLQPTTRAQL